MMPSRVSGRSWTRCISLSAACAAVLALAVALPCPLAAQTPAPKPPAIRGYVFDSLLTHAPLDGAVVLLSGAVSRSIKADVHGRFFFDSLPTGSYTITFTHPLLDTLGFAAPERSVEVPASGTVRLYLSTPSGDRVYERLCPVKREAETGVVLGSVLDAGSEARLAGAEVRAEWVEHVVSKELGISRRARFARATTDSLG